MKTSDLMIFAVLFGVLGGAFWVATLVLAAAGAAGPCVASAVTGTLCVCQSTGALAAWKHRKRFGL